MRPIDEARDVVERDEQGVVRAWFDPRARYTGAAKTFDAEEAAEEMLKTNAGLLGLASDLEGLVRPVGALKQEENAVSVRRQQTFKGVAVENADIVVNAYNDGQIYSLFNNTQTDIPDELDPGRVSLGGEAARHVVEEMLAAAGYDESVLFEPELLIHKHRPEEHREEAKGAPDKAPPMSLLAERMFTAARLPIGRYAIVWAVAVEARNPNGVQENLRILVDAVSGQVVDVIDLAKYASVEAWAFDPNPIVTSGNLALRKDSPPAALAAELRDVVLERLDEPASPGDALRLRGRYVRIENLEPPAYDPPTSEEGPFRFPPKADGNASSYNRDFMAVMVYYHLDSFLHYVEERLGLADILNGPIRADPVARNGQDNSAYLTASKVLLFGEGGVPDATDAHVILHELGHAIQDAYVPGFDGYSSGIGEGFGDFLAAVYFDSHAVPAKTRGRAMAWDANPADAFWPGRFYNVPWLFDGPEFGSANGHGKGQLWCAVMYELYRKLGGDSRLPRTKADARDLAIRLHLLAHRDVPKRPSPTQMAIAILAAANGMGGWRYPPGLHRKVIEDTFARRRLPGFRPPATDLYVDDGRAGTYGSATGRDEFGETLWQQAFWEARDVWSVASPYATPAAQAQAGPHDHVDPEPGRPAFLYVRIGNRGEAPAQSEPLSVRAYRAAPAIGHVWPDSWSELDASSAAPSAVPAPGQAVVAGPFKWRPSEGGEALLVAVACEADPLVNDMAFASPMLCSELAPFDNNVAMRNVHALTVADEAVFRFDLVNPDDGPRVAALAVDGTLASALQWRIDLPSPEEVRLAAGESLTVALHIARRAGAAAAAQDAPVRLVVTGLLRDVDEAPDDGRLLGGLTLAVRLQAVA